MHVSAETLYGDWVDVWLGGCELVGKWFAAQGAPVGAWVGWSHHHRHHSHLLWAMTLKKKVIARRGTAHRDTTHHQHFSVKRCTSAQKPSKVGGWVTK